jgi:uncharacterized protein YndB with AHSA1/START domain
MPTAKQGRASIDIAAPPELVYDLIADVPRMGEWSPERYRCKWLDGTTSAAVGARFRGYNGRPLPVGDHRRHHHRRPRMRIRVTVVHAVTGRDETRWRYHFEPSPSGTLLTESFDFVWCPLRNRVTELFIPRGRQLDRGIQQTLQRIKAAAESVHAT